MAIKALILDLDDTLYDEKQFVRSGFKAVSKHMAEKYGIDDEKLYNLLLKIFSEQSRTKVFDKALMRLRLYKRETVLEMVEVYRNHFPDISLYKDTLQVLPKMKKKYHLALLTGGIKKVQENKVKALNIADLFDVITYAVEHGGKKSVQPFQVILTKLHITPLETLYVDDNPMKGFVAAKKLGIRTVRMLRGRRRDHKSGTPVEPDFEISSLQELHKIIADIEQFS